MGTAEIDQYHIWCWSYIFCRHINKTGEDLYSLATLVLTEIKENLQKGDTSSKGLLKKLAEIDKDDEESVQNWLAEQLILRNNKRYHTHSESEVSVFGIKI